MTRKAPWYARWRANLVQELTGDVLEIGVGTGANLPYYRRAGHVWGIEPDIERAGRAAKAAARAPVGVTIDRGTAEALPYPDQSFDHVVSSLVFCSVTEPARVLSEIRRVLRPGGALHMIEHVHPTTPVLARLFAAMTPWWRQVAHNCHLDRPTVETLAAAGWAVTVHRRRLFVVRLTARPV